MIVNLNLDISCPICCNEDVNWQITTSSKYKDFLIVDTICDNKEHKFGRQYMTYSGIIFEEEELKEIFNK